MTTVAKHVILIVSLGGIMTFGKRRNKVVEEEEEDTTAEEPSESTQKLKINLGQLLGGDEWIVEEEEEIELDSDFAITSKPNKDSKYDNENYRIRYR